MMLPQTDRFCSNPKHQQNANSHFVFLKGYEALPDIKRLATYMDANMLILMRYLQDVLKSDTLRGHYACPSASFISYFSPIRTSIIILVYTKS
jgi:hypothetical protein